MKKIRVWKLGSLEHGIYPSDVAFDKLTKLLQLVYEKEDGTVDLIWGPDLEVFEIPLEPDGIIFNKTDFVVSAQELRDALTIVKANREVKSNESNS